MTTRPRPRPRRRLKKSVKLAFTTIAILLLVVIVRPWRFSGSSSGSNRDSVAVVTQVPLNQMVSNADSDIPEAARFDLAVEGFMRKWDIVGASLAIMKDGNLIYSKGYGLANRDSSEVTEVRHIFRIASVSKLITAVGVMKLCEQGLLSLHSTIFGPRGVMSNYTDYSDKKLEKITVENLLRHQGGFSTRAGDPMFNVANLGLKMPVTPDAMTRYVIRHGIRYTPGTRTDYSNYGYMLLTQVIEKVTGQPYEKYIKDSILAPIGCYDMHIGHPDPKDRHPNEVRYYETKEAERIPAADGSGRLVPKSDGGNDIELLGGAGGWVASPVELLKFIAAIDYACPHKNFLSTHTIKSMVNCAKADLPIGWANVNDKGDWWRSGSMAGTNAMLRRQSNGYTWVFLTNTSSWKGHTFAPIINSMLQNAFGKVTEWPEKDLFKTTEQEN